MGVLLSSALHITSSHAAATADAIVLEAPSAPREQAQLLKLRPVQPQPRNAPNLAKIEAVTREQGARAGALLAQRTLKAAELAYGPDDPQTLTPLINLAHLQQQSKDIAKALLSYKRAVELAESTGGPRNPKLFDAWNGIGQLHLNAGQYPSALGALKTALQLNRIASGLYNEDQLPILHAIAQAERAVGKAEEADQRQVDRMVLAERIHGLNSVGAAETYLAVGRWFRRTGNVDRSIALHGLAVQILEEKHPNDPRLIDPLIELATSSSRRRLEFDQPPLPPNLRPQIALSKAEQIIDAHSAHHPEVTAKQRILLGNAQFHIGKRKDALANYAKAAALLKSIGKPSPFDRPVLVDINLPPTSPVDGDGGYIVANFEVTDKGKIKRIRVSDYQPRSVPPALRDALTDALKAAQVRPRLFNGRAVASKGVQFRLRLSGKGRS